MNNRYMDFVPGKVTKTAGPRAATAKTTTARTTVVRAAGAKPAVKRISATKTGATRAGAMRAGATRAAVKKTAVVKRQAVVRETPKATTKVITSAKKTAATQSSKGLSLTPGLGVIEDLSPKFVKTEVPKRPLSDGRARRDLDEDLKAVKSRKVGVSKRGKKKEEEKKPEKKATGASETFTTPKSPFISHAKVAKRPLSKNVYQKKIEPSKEKETGPVTIITKPEKDSSAGIVIGIILTVVFGALAGTVAFLLLPR